MAVLQCYVAVSRIIAPHRGRRPAAAALRPEACSL